MNDDDSDSGEDAPDVGKDESDLNSKSKDINSKGLKRKHGSNKVDSDSHKQEKQIKTDSKILDSSENKLNNSSNSNDQDSQDDESSEESEESGSEDNDDHPNINNLNDLKESDKSDSEIEDCSERIGSFFDFKSNEGDNLKVRYFYNYVYDASKTFSNLHIFLIIWSNFTTNLSSKLDHIMVVHNILIKLICVM